ncbi:tRNA (adenosine(37)-N6)-threonylcarbamoyltransferase complex ATPase subunit type 1 TsaE [Desertivirga xinjiangensis]|uniref:tRNA (adenosine(37)-N6)-threonylcarbamoyltransferase complex ATPase subunit type 1 TsaE n=1 Tax=Desertivirga xinjiangensis TaxID=539206 RepID=UPI00210D5F61|nr:tRNA (adenosine(37)-N6)-threonylcarbamoyltransferase complex ATPase subunit type 1 TsaE [Pedobacter xinjiangensis]
MEYCVSSVSELKDVAQKILNFAERERVFLFFGEMGAGKTTFIKELCSTLGVSDITSSPTFSIVNEYNSQQGPVYHFDFYRLKNESEALDLGYEDYFYSGNFCFIEWSEKIPNLLPPQSITVKIEVVNDDQRLIMVNKK